MRPMDWPKDEFIPSLFQDAKVSQSHGRGDGVLSCLFALGPLVMFHEACQARASKCRAGIRGCRKTAARMAV